ncbi:hypothetical protein F6476_07630 [Pseudomonas umsongensis]|uniref:Uncharacterized protein n=1 Tax=Pseudomonas umsongensis TaxID=198618 RepID=A0ABX4DN87_9PSED|nr:hypothetical protein PSUM_29470 [Pseudomonas umsongensis]QFG29083.1 hypothetical protein F6476_07630 [Pseudomonas umsongensis]
MLPDSFVSVVLVSSRAGSLPQGIGGDQKTVGASLLAMAFCQTPQNTFFISKGAPHAHGQT